MLKVLREQLCKFLSTFLHNTLVLILTAIIGVPVLVSWVLGTLDTLIQTLKEPMPIWATIVLLLVLSVYFYTRLQKICSTLSVLVEDYKRLESENTGLRDKIGNINQKLDEQSKEINQLKWKTSGIIPPPVKSITDPFK